MVFLAALCAVAGLVRAETVEMLWSAAQDVPLRTDSYSASGKKVSLALGFAPATGMELMAVDSTGTEPIGGTFDNLAQGQGVGLAYGGRVYRFVANYFGGNGNDLVLVPANTRAFAWGYNFYGQLGDNSSTLTHLQPGPVTASGALAGRTVTVLAAGGGHSLALCADGALAAWGYNGYGQIGDGTLTERRLAVLVSAASSLGGKVPVAIAAGGYHNLALCSDGTVVAWGRNDFGQLGDNTITSRSLPVAVNTNMGVSALYGKKVLAIAAGVGHSLALCSDGTVAAWGYNYSGQLGDTTTTQRKVPVAVNTNSGVSALFGKHVVAISSGANHNLALCSDGTLASWGGNDSGQLGDNTTTTAGRSAAVTVTTNSMVSALYGKEIRAIQAGGYHSLASCSDGTLTAWGYNSFGELGDNTTINRLAPIAVNSEPGVSVLAGKSVTAIAAGTFHSLARCSDGTIVGWGKNGFGQLGDGTKTNRLVPTMVSPSAPGTNECYSLVASGSYADHTLALSAGEPLFQALLTGAARLPNGSFGFGFTNTPGAAFDALGTTNPALPLSDWIPLGGVIEVSPGTFRFTDSQATNNPQRFYTIRPR